MQDPIQRSTWGYCALPGPGVVGDYERALDDVDLSSIAVVNVAVLVLRRDVREAGRHFKTPTTLRSAPD